MTTNRELHNLVEEYDLSISQLMSLTGRSRTHVYGWLCDPVSKHYKSLRPKDLRLIRLELAIDTPYALEYERE
jgi:hypothetical protein